jgi:hypothetical protein
MLLALLLPLVLPVVLLLRPLGQFLLALLLLLPNRKGFR